MSSKRLAAVSAVCLLLAACGSQSGEGSGTAPTTTVEMTTSTHEEATHSGPITDLEALAGTWYLGGPTGSAMHFAEGGEWWWAKSELALELKMEREPDGRVVFEGELLVFAEDDVCHGEEHGYAVIMSAGGVDFVGNDLCTRRLMWLSPPSGTTTWSSVQD